MFLSKKELLILWLFGLIMLLLGYNPDSALIFLGDFDVTSLNTCSPELASQDTISLNIYKSEAGGPEPIPVPDEVKSRVPDFQDKVDRRWYSTDYPKYETDRYYDPSETSRTGVNLDDRYREIEMRKQKDIDEERKFWFLIFGSFFVARGLLYIACELFRRTW